MKKILFVITTLGGGGAERIVSYLSNWFSLVENCEVSLLLLKEEGNTYLPTINEKVHISNLKIKGRLRYNVLSIVKTILKIKPDICFIGLDGLNILISPFLPILKMRGIKTIVRETNVLSRMWKPTFFNRVAYRLFYNQYNSVICQSKDMVNDLIKVWKIRSEKISLINNPIDIDTVQQCSIKPLEACEIPEEVYFVAVGRLTKQKGFKNLIKLIAVLKSKGKFPFKLLILGDGELRKELECQIKKLGLKNTVKLLGRVDNPYRIMRNAKGFILSSQFEGFPNVLLEAHALGIPVLANNCPGGINEIIIDGINGLIVNFDDTKSFEESFERFVSISFDNKRIVELTRLRYDSSVIFPLYKKVFLG